MLKILILFFIMVITNHSEIVNAINTFYVNDNGIKMTETEYNKLNKIYSKKQLKSLNESEYNKAKNLNIVSSNSIYVKDIYKNGILVKTEYINEEEFNKIEKLKTIPAAQQFSTDNSFVETTYKKLSVSLIDTGSFMLVAGLNWLKVPKVRSYDIFAFRVNHFNFSNVVGSQTYYVGDYPTVINYNSSSPGYKGFTDGAGISMNLKDGTEITGYVLSLAADLQINNFNHRVALAYANYQHAVQNISRTTSKRYSLDVSGYGNTILLDPAIESYYDGMSGVHVSTPIP